MHSGQRRTDQSIINLLRDGPTARIDLLVTCVELFQIAGTSVDRGRRPVAHAARALESIYVVCGKGRVFRPPTPKVVSELVERFGSRLGLPPHRTRAEKKKDQPFSHLPHRFVGNFVACQLSEALLANATS